MVLKFYFDLMSQPARAVLLFLKVNNIKFVECPIALRKGENLDESYRKINPFQKVPCIDDDGFKLSESVAILKYLTDKYGASDESTQTWYPQDLRQRARVDEYLAWQHFNTRAHAAFYFRTLAIDPVVTGKPIDYGKAEEFKSHLAKTLDYLETVYLGRGRYLCGNHITIADLLGVCELEQPMSVGLNVLENRPVLRQWMDEVRQQLQPHYDDAHSVIYKFSRKFQEKQKAKL